MRPALFYWLLACHWKRITYIVELAAALGLPLSLVAVEALVVMAVYLCAARRECTAQPALIE
jgi:hypothetical protein